MFGKDSCERPMSGRKFSSSNTGFEVRWGSHLCMPPSLPSALPECSLPLPSNLICIWKRAAVATAPWIPVLIQPGERDGENRWNLAVGRTRQEGQGPDLLLWLKVSLRRSEAGILVREGGKERVKGKEAEERRQKKRGFHKGKLLILSVINHA